MKRQLYRSLYLGAFLLAGAVPAQGLAANDQAETVKQEQLHRGFIAIKTSTGNLLQWRALPQDAENQIEYVIKAYSTAGTESEIIVNAGEPTNYLDTQKRARYTLMIRQNGEVLEEQTQTDITPMASQLTQIKLNRPTGSGCTYSPNDCSVGDVDGDGEYEIIVKWDPSNSQDNSKSGKTGNTYFDCYEIYGQNAGHQLWRIDLGVNVRAGAHYSPFLVYDFDGDGKAEFVVKTAPGSKDNAGDYVTAAGQSSDITGCANNTKDYRNSDGHILKGEEFLTIFSGETGKALATTWYWPNLAREAKSGTSSTSYSWSGDSYGNRGHRYNACVAYLDGLDNLPSIIMQRGYYTQAFFWAVDWDGEQLKTRWLHRGTSSSAWSVIDKDGKSLGSGSGKSSYGQGVHGISVGDVDDDGFDEIVMGSTTIDHNGKLLCSTGFGHGDAIHLGKILPDRPGLQVYMPHEESGCGYGDDLHDAATGEVIYRGYTSADNGRGLACDMYSSINSATGLDTHLGWEMWSGAMSKPINALTQAEVGSKPDTNFRCYWNGDLYDESLDGRFSSSTNTCTPRILYWNGSKNAEIKLSSFGGQPQSCNYTKATPCLVADLWGDWREEIVMWDLSDYATLDIYTTVEKSSYPVPCLMTDHVYRMGVAWQNSSYNQPPHLGYYLPDAFLARYTKAEGSGEYSQTMEDGAEMTPIVLKVKNVESISKSGIGLQLGPTVNLDREAGTVTISGAIVGAGTYKNNVITMKSKYNTCKVTLTFTVTEATTGIEETREERHAQPCFDLGGRLIGPEKLTSGQVYLQGGKKMMKQ